VAEYFLGVPVRREKEEVGTIMFVEKAEPEILRQSVQWHIACDEWLARLWFVEGGRMEERLERRTLLAGSPS
jgi:hypothetical protein